MATKVVPKDDIPNDESKQELTYFKEFKNESEALNENVYHCASKLTIYLGETKTYSDGRCMLTNNYMIWRNLAYSPSKRHRILFNLKHVKAITIKQSGKLSFTAPRLLIYLNELKSNAKSISSQQYIQLAFKNGADSRNLFAKKLQSIIASKTIETENDSKEDNYEILKNIIIKENIIDEIHEKYIKITVSEFASAIQTLYYIQGYSSTQNTIKYNHMKSASEIITKIVRYDNNTHHLKLPFTDINIICSTYFNYEPYLEISNPKQITAGNSYTSYHCNRFIDINSYIFRLFEQIYPIKVGLKIQQQWIEIILRCTWYIDDNEKNNELIIKLMDILIKKIWNVKFIPMDNINFNDKYNLLIIKHILCNYCHPENIPQKCHFYELTKIYLSKTNQGKKKYANYLIEILNIPALKKRFEPRIVHKVMIELVTKYKYGKSNYLILEFIKYIKTHINTNMLINDYLHLQCYLKGVIDEDESLKVIELNLLINYKILYLKYNNKYNGLDAIEYAKSKQVKPNKIITFLENKMETYNEYYDKYEDDQKLLFQNVNHDNVTENYDDVNLNDTANANMNALNKIMDMIYELQKDINELKVTNKILSDELLKEKEQKNDDNNDNNDNEDENKIDIDGELENCNKELIVNKDWRNWTYLEIIQYIIELDDGKYNKYKNLLFNKMKEKEIKGSDLLMMEKMDLTNFFGIVNYGDVCNLWNQIKELTQS